MFDRSPLETATTPMVSTGIPLVDRFNYITHDTFIDMMSRFLTTYRAAFSRDLHDHSGHPDLSDYSKAYCPYTSSPTYVVTSGVPSLPANRSTLALAQVVKLLGSLTASGLIPDKFPAFDFEGALLVRTFMCMSS